MNNAVPQSASAVIIGGGVIGASVAYHLAKLGWNDVLLLERKQFASGTSWHAAGLIGQVRAHEALAELTSYTRQLLVDLAHETGQSTGFREVGSLTIAHSRERFTEIIRLADTSNAFGFTRVEVVTAEEIRSLYPYLRTDDLLGGTYTPSDGHASPVDVVTAYIKGARLHGARCLENVKVTKVLTAGGRVSGVVTDQGAIDCQVIVNAAGLWARDIGRMAGVNVPLYACEHYYAHTEKIKDLPKDLPVLRDPDRCAYYREDAGSLLVGGFEATAIPLSTSELALDFCFDSLPGHVDTQFLPILEDALKRLPILGDIGWRSFFCGPESFTPDDQFHVGEAPELRNFYVACGLNSVGIATSGGLGKCCAEWIDGTRAPLDLFGNDIRRMFPFQGNEAYLRDRSSETLGLLYARHYPYRQYETGRCVRLSPLHQRLSEHNACFGEVAGWERANWFAPPGVTAAYEYSFERQNWFAYSAAEHRAVREGVALFDQSSFAKYTVQGRDACRQLQKICTANVDVAVGRIVYTHWLNQDGGIEADLTVTRISEHEYFIVSGAASAVRDLNWLQRHIDSDARCWTCDVTAAWAVLGVMGPKSRAVVEAASAAVLDNDHFAFGTAQDIAIGYACGRALRVSYVGELGWELYLPSDMAIHAFDRILAAGREHGLQLAGMHALDSCRIEKKFVHLGHDVSITDTPPEAGLRFVCNLSKNTPFIGREAIIRQLDSEHKLTKRLLQFRLADADQLLYHGEPVRHNGKVVGYLTSGNYGHTLGAAIGLGYVHCAEGVSSAWVAAGEWSIDVAGVRVPASASLRAMYDPSGSRTRC